MRIACVTTTINVPRVLSLYTKQALGVQFFIIGDRKTPDVEVVNFLTEHVPNHAYYGIDDQYKLGYKCARLIPENCIQRRNIGFLEALKWGADVIVSIDDDNIPYAINYFDHFSYWQFDGMSASSESAWFDVGTLLQPQAEHRGFPHTRRSPPIFESVVDARIGVAAGVCLGDPDISAVTRIANAPIVHNVSEILQAGVVTDPKRTWTVFNSQNTAFVRDLAPAMFMFPGVGRYDDIYASLVCQRLMRYLGLFVHFGRPFVWQQRNKHDLIKDLKAEIEGMEHVLDLAARLDHMQLSPGEHPVRTIFKNIAKLPWFPQQASEAALAWCDDCEAILK